MRNFVNMNYKPKDGEMLQPILLDKNGFAELFIVKKKTKLQDEVDELKALVAELRKELQPISKALNYKTKKVSKKEKDDDFLQKFRASQLF